MKDEQSDTWSHSMTGDSASSHLYCYDNIVAVLIL